jgi:hypothetical protein
MGNISLIFNRTYFPPEFNSEDPGAVEAGESIDLIIDGGQAPFDCQIVGGTGSGFTVEGISNGCRLTAGENPSGYVQIQATDNQGNQTGTWSVGGVDCSSCIDISFDYSIGEGPLDREDSLIIGVESTGSSCGYFDWTVSGTGFSLQNTRTYTNTNVLITDNIACGSAIVTVTDACGHTTTGEFRCSYGGYHSCVVTGYQNNYNCTSCGANLGGGVLYSPNKAFYAQAVSPGQVCIGCVTIGGNLSADCNGDIYSVASVMHWDPKINIRYNKGLYFRRWEC